MNTRRIVAELAGTDAGRLLLIVDELGGQARSEQVAEATGFTRTYVHKLTRRLSRYELVMLDQQSLADEIDLTPLAREAAAQLR
ncbi:hypothetical protein [Kocuria arenosa]|uniref:hypothetical protein n=1 Tax=Kocuria arenosa TaxID=3071446 RepID=UPI0034D3CBD3